MFQKKSDAMSKLVVLNLGAGDLNKGFPYITAQLRTDNGGFEQFTGSLPPNPELATLYYNWQTLYQALHQCFDVARRRLFEVKGQGLTNISVKEFQELCQEIETKFNLWLESSSFSPIDKKLRTKLTPDEEIQIIVETKDIILHGFPWHLWHFLEDYQQAEIGISTPEYSLINISKKSRNKLRILAVLGHSEGINIELDRALIQEIKNAEITFLVEPKSAEFHQKLWDEEGWDMLFFAGHSHTENHQGIIFINPKESLTIKELKTALNQAIKQGLKLAIFNSCDGIGLAQELTKLNIPQVIVMREGVPDLIAQEFLKYFLTALQQNKSVFCALREARERLQAWDKDFPGGSWLPMICQNLSTFNLEIKLQESLKIFPNLSVDFWHKNNDIDLENTIFYKKIKETNLFVKIIDITTLDVDVIVSSDDNYLKMGGGVSASILKKGGNSIKEHALKFAPIKLGDVIMTSAGNLSAKYVFHAAVLDYELYYHARSKKPTINIVQEVTKKCLKLAESVNAQSIAFPALATGVGGLPPEQSALGIMIEIMKVLKSNTSLKTIIIALYGHQNSNVNTIKEIKNHFLNQVSHFIDIYQQMETRYELLKDLENIFSSYDIKLASDITSQYQEKLTEIMNQYIDNISNGE
ncbi:macro domain-containing protein [Geminocystis herdmanii]|uniref:macro domain-containing protein n=1 Tax=Geminocystis herdmanii TaxID=669359 RepID=UPI00034CF4C1|nr:macro domain-containing protein [Geminocystis herdmanii]